MVIEQNPVPGLLIRTLQLLLVITFPLLLVFFCIRLVMTPAFLSFEYNRPDFPEDFFGLTREDRLQYAPYAIEYLLNGEDINFLGDLNFPDGTPLFNNRELRHMQDVKIITQYTYTAALVIGVIALISGLILWRNPSTRTYLRTALFWGSLLTLGIIAAIIIVAILNWDFFFVTFHTLFFESDTWYFAYSDTLIRLFPEQFWFDSALLVGSLSTLIAIMVLFVTWRWGRRASKRFDTALA